MQRRKYGTAGGVAYTNVCGFPLILFLAQNPPDDLTSRLNRPAAKGDPPPVLFFGVNRQFHLCVYWKWNDIGLLCRGEREADALRLRDTVLAPQMPVRFHCECTAVLVSKPAGNGWNINA